MGSYRWIILVFGILAYATSHFARQNYTGAKLRTRDARLETAPLFES